MFDDDNRTVAVARTIDRQAQVAAGGTKSFRNEFLEQFERAEKLKYRLRLYRFVAILLAIFCGPLMLLVHVYSKEMAHAAQELHLANEDLSAYHARLIADRQAMNACKDQIQILEGARIGAALAR